MANRLAGATSPYLQQHADNPVDWWPWGPEAFAEARRRDVPVLISVGYAACHWCHVMAHESFEDDAVAAVVNGYPLPIKVDREERPDVDAVYMTATQAMTGQGGWPMTVFATPDGEPFFCGTYYPRDAFTGLVRAVADAWRERRDAVLQQGAALVEALSPAATASSGALSAAVLDAAAASVASGYDSRYGGFGGAPKFPPHLSLLFLLRHHERTGDPGSLEIARYTAERMARGGIYDQLAGGFARYAVDRTWTVPHFEKMLYDNALLLRVYTQLWRLTGDALAYRIAAETAGFLLTGTPLGLSTVEGGFASALDADTDGVEGATYAWTPAQLREVLGEADGSWAAQLFGVTGAGTFEHGASVLQLPNDPAGPPDPAAPSGADGPPGADGPDDAKRWEDVRARLLAARATRAQPARDDKVVAAWNGLAITALAEWAALSGGPASAAALSGARRAAELVAQRHLVDGRLRRVSRDGVVGSPAGVLDDYGCLAEAFCTMHQVSGEGRWLELAGQLLDTALAHFSDGAGGFYDTADDAERLIVRPADPTDNATPSGLSSMAAALAAYAALTGQLRYREAAEAALGRVAAMAKRHARFVGYACAVGEALVGGAYEIAIVGRGREADAMVAAAWRLAPPGTVIVAGEPDAPGVPLLAQRPIRDGRPTAYVCRGFVCDAPVSSEQELIAKLSPARG